MFTLKGAIYFSLCILSDSEKEEAVKEMKAAISVAPKNMTAALGSLMSSYGEDMTESDKDSDGEQTPGLILLTLPIQDNRHINHVFLLRV